MFRGMVQEVIAGRAQPKIEEQLTAFANETTSKMIAELKSTGVVDDLQAKELVDKVRPTINVNESIFDLGCPRPDSLRSRCGGPKPDGGTG